MNGISLAEWITLALVGSSLGPAVWILGREVSRRRATQRALEQVRAARSLLGQDAGAVPDAALEKLKQRFDAMTMERAVLVVLRDDDPTVRAWGARLFEELGLAAVYAKRLREARRWSERTYAAEVLGQSGLSAAIPALVACLRDPDEDEANVKVAAAAALAKLRDASAIPLLVGELGDADARSSRNVAEALVAFGALAVADLQKVLASGSGGQSRVWAARILGRIGDARATDDLVARLYDRDDLLRMAAAEALGGIGDARALQPLVRATLRDPAPQVRAHAAGAVAKIEGARAIDVLVSALADPDHATRLRALEAFETIKVDDTTPLEAALRDPNAEVRRRAALALERVGYLDGVIKRLTAEDRDERARAFASLLELGRVGLVDSIASYVHHASFEVRALAARAVGELGQARVGPLLATACDDEAWPVRAAVCEAMGRLRFDGAIPLLVKRLSDSEESVREAAAEALTNATEEELAAHVEAVVMGYDNGNVPVRTHMIVLASRLRLPSADDLLVRASEDPSDGVRGRAVRALSERRGERVIDALVARLNDASLEVRIAAVSALGAATSRPAFEGLLKALPGAAVDVRERVAEALSKGARELLFERLGELEQNASLDVRLGVAWTLGKTSDPRAVPTLARFLRDPNAPLRASAAGALAKIESPAAVDALLAAGDDPDGRVRAAVVNALGRAGPGYAGRGDTPDERVVAALGKRLRDPDAFVRNRAIVAVARAGRSSAETLVRGAAHVERAPLLVALALVGSERAISDTLEAIADTRTLEEIRRFLAREDAALRATFYTALGLEDLSDDDVPIDENTVVSQYESMLRTSLDVTTRRLAVRALSKLHGDRAVEVLGDALGSDPDETIRLAAARALAPRADETLASRALLRAMGDPHADVAVAAVEGLAARRDKATMSAFVRRLGSGEERVQTLVEHALAEFHRADPFPFLDWMLGADVPELLVPGIRVLALMGNPVTMPILAELAKSRAPTVRAQAVRALGALGTTEARAAVDAMVQDPHEDVRIGALELLAKTDDVVLRTAPFRRDPSFRVRVRAAVALEHVAAPGARAAHKALEAMLDDAVSEVRAAAFASLAASPDREGLVLFARAWAKSALETRLSLHAEPRARVISERLAASLSVSASPNDRRHAIIALGAFAVAGFEAMIVPALRDPSADVRIAALQALAPSDDEDVRRRVSDCLTDPEPAVRDAARRSMIRAVR